MVKSHFRAPADEPQNFLAVKLDVTKKADIDAAFKAAIDKFKR